MNQQNAQPPQNTNTSFNIFQQPSNNPLQFQLPVQPSTDTSLGLFNPGKNNDVKTNEQQSIFPKPTIDIFSQNQPNQLFQQPQQNTTQQQNLNLFDAQKVQASIANIFDAPQGGIVFDIPQDKPPQNPIQNNPSTNLNKLPFLQNPKIETQPQQVNQTQQEINALFQQNSSPTSIFQTKQNQQNAGSRPQATIPTPNLSFSQKSRPLEKIVEHVDEIERKSDFSFIQQNQIKTREEQKIDRSPISQINPTKIPDPPKQKQSIKQSQKMNEYKQQDLKLNVQVGYQPSLLLTLSNLEKSLSQQNGNQFDTILKSDRNRISRSFIEGYDFYLNNDIYEQMWADQDKLAFNCVQIRQVSPPTKKILLFLVEQISVYLDCSRYLAFYLVDQFFSEFNDGRIKQFFKWISDGDRNQIKSSLIISQIQTISSTSRYFETPPEFDQEQQSTIKIIKQSLFNSYFRQRLIPTEFLLKIIVNISITQEKQKHPAYQFLLNIHSDLIIGLFKQYLNISKNDENDKFDDSENEEYFQQLLLEQKLLLEAIFYLNSVFEYSMNVGLFLQFFTLLKEQNFTGNWIKIKQKLQSNDLQVFYKTSCTTINQINVYSQFVVFTCFEIPGIFNAMMKFEQMEPFQSQFSDILPFQVLRQSSQAQVEQIFNDSRSKEVTLIKYILIQLVQLFNPVNIKNYPERLSDNPIQLMKLLISNECLKNTRTTPIFSQSITNIFACFSCLMSGNNDNNDTPTICMASDLLVKSFKNIQLKDLYHNQEQEQEDITQSDDYCYRFKPSFVYQQIHINQLYDKKYKFLSGLIANDYCNTRSILSHLSSINQQNDWFEEIYSEWFDLLIHIHQEFDSVSIQDQEYVLPMDVDFLTQNCSNIKSKIKLVCKLIWTDPESLEEIEAFLFDNNSGQVYRGYGIIMMLLDTLYLFSRLKEPLPFKILTHVVKALQAIMQMEQRNQKYLLLNLIQLYPSTIFEDEDSTQHNRHPLLNYLMCIDCKQGADPKSDIYKFRFLKQSLKFFKNLLIQFESPFEQIPCQFNMKQSQVENKSVYDQLYSNKLYNRFQNTSSPLMHHRAVYQFEQIDVQNELIVNNQLVFSHFFANYIDLIFQRLYHLWGDISVGLDQKALKFKIGSYLFDIADLVLQKFIFNTECIKICQLDSTIDQFTQNWVHNLNSAPLSDMILKTFEIQNDQSHKRLQNTLMSLSGNDSKVMIVSACKLLETILNLISSYQENFTLINEIHVVRDFHRIFLNRPGHNYPVPVCFNNIKYKLQYNFVQAISILVTVDKYISNNQQNLYLAFQSNMSGMGQEYETSVLQFFDKISTRIDYTNINGLIQKKILQNGYYNESLSTRSLRVLTRVMMFWEQASIISGRPRINLYEILNQSQGEGSLISARGCTTQLAQELLNNVIYHQLEEVKVPKLGPIFDFLLIGICTQRQLMDLLLRRPPAKPLQLNSNTLIPFDSLLNAYEHWFKAPPDHNYRTTNKMVHFLFEIINQSSRYGELVKRFRQNTNSLYSNIAQRILQEVNEIDSLPKPNLLYEDSFLFDKFNKSMYMMVRKTVFESAADHSVVIYDSFSTFLQILSSESQSDQNMVVIQQTMVRIFHKIIDMNDQQLCANSSSQYMINFCNFLESNLKQGSSQITIYSDTFNTLQKIKNNSFFQSNAQDGSLSGRGFYKLLDVNLFGFGREYLFDSNEMIQILKLFRCQDQQKYFIWPALIHNFNVTCSLLFKEEQLLKSIQQIFSLVCSVSTKEVGMSSSLSSAGYLYSLKHLYPEHSIQSIIDQDDTVIGIVLPGYHLHFAYDFMEIMSINEGQNPKLKSFICIKKIIDKYVWGLSQLSSGMNEEMPGFDSKMTIIMTGLGALRYAMEQVHMEIQSSPDKSPLLQIYQNQFPDIKAYNQFFIGMIQKIIQNRMIDDEFTILIQAYIYYLSFVDSLIQNPQTLNKLNFMGLGYDNVPISGEQLLEIINKLFNYQKHEQSLFLLIQLVTKLFKIQPNYFIKCLDEGGDNLLKDMMFLYFMQDHTNPNIFQSLSQFFIELSWIEGGAAMLLKQNFHKQIFRSTKFKAINQPGHILYVNQEDLDYQVVLRDHDHVQWCWLLAVYKDMVINLQGNTNYFHQCTEFLEVFKDRLEGILQMSLYLPQNKYILDIFSSQETRIAPQQCQQFSIAYLQELELTLQLLVSFYSDSFNFRFKSDSLFENYLHILMRDTILIFQVEHIQNIQEFLKPQTKLEKDLDSTPWTNYNKILKYQKNTTQNQPYRRQMNENKTLFSFYAEICYLNILDTVVHIFKSAMPYSLLLDLMDKKKIFQNPNVDLYIDQNHTEQYAYNLYLLQSFIFNTLSNWINSEMTDKTLSSAFVMIQGVQNSIQWGISNGKDLSPPTPPPYNKPIENINTLYQLPDPYTYIWQCTQSVVLLFEVSIDHLNTWQKWRRQKQTLSSPEIIQFKEHYGPCLKNIFDILYKYLGQQSTQKMKQDVQLYLNTYSHIKDLHINLVHSELQNKLAQTIQDQ